MNNIQVSNRVLAALRRAGINDQQSLYSLSLHQVYLIPGIGVKGRAEVEDYLLASTAPEPQDFGPKVAEIDRLIVRLTEAKDLLIGESAGF